MFDIPDGLAGFLSNFVQRVALDKIEPQGLPLVFGQPGKYRFPFASPEHALDGIVRATGLGSGVRQRLRQLIQIQSVVKMASREVTPAT